LGQLEALIKILAFWQGNKYVLGILVSIIFIVQNENVN
jgi:hypothetical protein